jgi:rubrerythrin
MPLSDELSAALMNAFNLKTRVGPHQRLPFESGRLWYCPGCGVRMIEADHSLTCPLCHQSLNEFVFLLIELHPHKAVN